MSRMRAELPAKSPTVGSNWQSAIFISQNQGYGHDGRLANRECMRATVIPWQAQAAVRRCLFCGEILLWGRQIRRAVSAGRAITLLLPSAHRVRKEPGRSPWLKWRVPHWRFCDAGVQDAVSKGNRVQA